MFIEKPFPESICYFSTKLSSIHLTTKNVWNQYLMGLNIQSKTGGLL